ncbi:hypothetical protein [Robertkochia sediminum]|uniref:hypothetical protein n=1 Tax=Robertkochia sediminum TaxID=2785326 RepID=UPI001932807F|nr:hypothetical protein [Robertkochia sediminum]MBL7472077.1 hypothetical protein [Robertkochia sediminum]
MSFKNMRPKIKSFLLFTLFVTITLSCKKKHHESDDYEILSAVLNYAFGNESDLENGQGWIDETKEYHSLLLLNHTNLRSFDIESIDAYLTLREISEFTIEDFKLKHRWNIEKIKDYKRYRLVAESDQNIRSPYIGMVQISSISYNQNFDKAIIYISFLCAGNGDCGFSSILHLKKDKNWVIEKEEILSVS